MTTKPDNLIYAVDERPPLPILLALGLQQVCIMAIYLVIIVIVAHGAHASPNVMQSMVSCGMIALGLAAILQSLPKGPVGSGYLAPPVVSAIYLQPSLLAVESGGLSLLFGLTIAAGLFESVISLIFEYIRKFFPPLVSGLIIIAVGFELGLIGTTQLLDVKEEIYSELYLKHLVVSLLTLSLMIGLTVWASGKTRLFSAMIGILFGWILSFVAGLISPKNLDSFLEAPFFGFPQPNYIAYSVDIRLIVPFFIAALAAALRTIGVITTCEKINDANWKRPDKQKIKKGILADALGCTIGGVLGVPGMSSSPSAVGISQFTCATSKSIAFGIGIWLFLFACLPKISALFTTLPTSVVGATLMYTGSMMLVSGIQIITTHPLTLKQTFIVGISIFLGLSHEIFPQFYHALPAGIKIFTGTILSITTISAIILNVIFQIKSRQEFEINVDASQNFDKIDEMLRSKVKKWGGATDTAENSIEFLKILCREILDHNYAEGPILAKISYDDIALRVELSYQGKLLNINPSNRGRQSKDAMLEEMPMALGLSSFLENIFPDQIQSAQDNEKCSIKFSFELF